MGWGVGGRGLGPWQEKARETECAQAQDSNISRVFSYVEQTPYQPVEQYCPQLVKNGSSYLN